MRLCGVDRLWGGRWLVEMEVVGLRKSWRLGCFSQRLRRLWLLEVLLGSGLLGELCGGC